ncbi:MAG: hypothetical protein Fur0025_35410 [Oscillatoriaceae cyanobacterium]
MVFSTAKKFMRVNSQMQLSFIDTNIWLYRLFDDERIEPKERERKRNIAISITNQSNLLIKL